MKSSRMVAIPLALSGIVLAMVVALGSCGNDGDGGSETTVNVKLREFSLTPDQMSAPKGTVTFKVSNDGSDDHEFLVIKTDLAPDALPTEENGSYEEDGPGTDLLDEIEDIAPGGRGQLTLNLESGFYVLICNMVHQEGDELEVHYQLGMRAAFHVD